jgi:hypothetical protein
MASFVGRSSRSHREMLSPVVASFWASPPDQAEGLDGVAAQPVARYFANSGLRNPYAFTFTATTETHEVRVIYDDDYFNGTYAQALILQTVAVGCP